MTRSDNLFEALNSIDPGSTGNGNPSDPRAKQPINATEENKKEQSSDSEETSSDEMTDDSPSDKEGSEKEEGELNTWVGNDVDAATLAEAPINVEEKMAEDGEMLEAEEDSPEMTRGPEEGVLTEKAGSQSGLRIQMEAQTEKETEARGTH
ncbi:hypothetical protein R1flu_015927 [Riccia fluitans]|uniref:Uncharacterized protein n=1 Tax=Riccia fluitans TaxID=41844 RepID=A0ABD1YKC9_9MARC